MRGSGAGYDCDGNLTYDGSRTLAYDGDNRLVSVLMPGATTPVTLSYDPTGRLQQTLEPNGANPATVTNFVWDDPHLQSSCSASVS